LRLDANLVPLAVARSGRYHRRFALAPTFAVLMLVRAGSNISLLLAKGLSTCAEIFSDAGRRNRAIGILVSTATAGVIGGLPVVALIEDAAGWRWAMASLLAPLSLLLAGHRLLPAAAQPANATTIRARDRYRQVLGHRRARVLLFTGSVLGFTYIGWLTYLGAHIEVDYGGSARVLSLVFLVAGVGELVANNCIPAALKRWDATAIYLTAGVGYTAALAAGAIQIFATRRFEGNYPQVRQHFEVEEQGRCVRQAPDSDLSESLRPRADGGKATNPARRV
jgi:predicted MFS family arabinose efflux permease